MANRRIYYAVQSAGFASLGNNTFTAIHGLQQIGLNCKFNLEQVFEIGQLQIYDNVENVPDVEITTQKALDGYPPLYCLATKGAVSPSLGGRSGIKSTLGLSIYSDVQDSASGTPLAQITCSGVFPSNVEWNFTVNGPFTESLTLVGNDKTTTNSFTSPTFNNTDSPFAGDVALKQDLLIGSAALVGGSGCLFPTEIPGVTSSGTLEFLSDGSTPAHLQSIKVSCGLGRGPLYELGHRGPYFRYAQFPAKVSCDIEVISSSGDGVNADENATHNVFNQRIVLAVREGTKLDLGVKNKLAAVTYGGGNAGQNGGNATCVYSYETWSDLTVTHPQDPSGL